MNGWWHRASTEQKLAQVDAGIEIGLTARQVALACGVERSQTVTQFANYHERKFTNGAVRAMASLNRHAARKSARAAYFRGEEVDLWRDGVQDRALRHAEVEEIILE